MCTLSWIGVDSGYEVFFNRDELRTRAPSSAPLVFENGGVKFVAPIDGDSGGTWISVNEYGITCCLLNYHPVRESPADAESRGLLVLNLADARSAGEAVQRIGREPAGRFRPFTVVCFEPGESPHAVVFDGVTLEGRRLGPSDRPICSSSVTPAEIEDLRRDQFREMAADPGRDELLGFHRSHRPQESAQSVCMHRPDARSVSFSHIVVGTERVDFHFCPDSPCRGTVKLAASLERSSGMDPSARSA